MQKILTCFVLESSDACKRKCSAGMCVKLYPYMLLYFVFLQAKASEDKQPKASRCTSTETVQITWREVQDISVLLAAGELKTNSDHDNTRNILLDDIFDKSGQLIHFCVALAKGICQEQLSDETLLKANQAVESSVHNFEQFACLWK